MSLFKRENSPYWWIKITHKGRSIQRSTGTSDRNSAQEYHDKVKMSLWEEDRLGVKPRRVWQEAVIRYLRETTHKASHETDKFHFRWLDPYLRDVVLTEIKRDFLEELIAAKLKEDVQPATVNRIMEVVRAVLRKAANEWEWIERVPSFRFLKEPTRRIRFLTRPDALRLLLELPPHLKALVQFSLETGLRKSNVTGLQWDQIDMSRRCAWIHPDQAKAWRAIAVPLSKVAMEVVRSLMGQHHTHVFTYRGNPIIQVNTKAWHAALRRAGIINFRWHDLRHTWASWHAQAGTPLHILQELGGWESAEMVRRYAHLTSDHLIPFVDRLTAIQQEGRGEVATFQLHSAK